MNYLLIIDNLRLFEANPSQTFQSKFTNITLNTAKQWQIGNLFADDIFKSMLLNENSC